MCVKKKYIYYKYNNVKKWRWLIFLRHLYLYYSFKKYVKYSMNRLKKHTRYLRYYIPNLYRLNHFFDTPSKLKHVYLFSWVKI